MTNLVPENEQQYGSVLTVLGENAEQNGKLLNKQVEFTHIAFGDANDTYVQPDRKSQVLVNELHRIPINSVDVLQPTPDSVPILKVEAIVPDDINDVVIREFAAVATFNGETYFHAIGNCARVYIPKPINNGNVSNPVTLEMTFIITSAEPIVEIDPNVVTASRQYADEQSGSLIEQLSQTRIFPKSLNQYVEIGHAQRGSVPDKTDLIRLISASGVVEVYEMHPPRSGSVSKIDLECGSIEFGSESSKLRRYNSQKVKSGAFVIFDDATKTVADDLVPIGNAVGIEYGLAVYISALASGYQAVRIEDILKYKKAYGVEVFNHSSNSEPLNASMDESYGASLIKTAKQFFDQCGFETAGFVAPNSILDSKFLPTMKDVQDFAFVRSAGDTSAYNSVNTRNSDFYHLSRVSLEANGMTLEKAKALVDYVMVRNQGEQVVFYTHTDTGWVKDLMEYIRDIGASLTPSNWVSQYKPLLKVGSPTNSQNLFSNSEFKNIAGSANGWSLLNGTFDNINPNFISYSNGYTIDLTGNASAADQYATLAQNYFLSGGVQKMSVFNASMKVTGLAATNVKVEIGIYVKDGANVTLASSKQTYVVSGGEQVIDATMGVAPDSSISYILVQYKILSIDAGPIRVIMSEPKLAQAGKFLPYDLTSPKKYRSTLRRTQSLTVPDSTPTDIVFNQRLQGSDGLYDLVTGEFTGLPGEAYRLDVQAGMKNLAAGDKVTLQILVDGAINRQAHHSAPGGDNVFELSLPVFFADGNSKVKVAILNESGATKSLTAYNDCMLTIASL